MEVSVGATEWAAEVVAMQGLRGWKGVRSAGWAAICLCWLSSLPALAGQQAPQDQTGPGAPILLAQLPSLPGTVSPAKPNEKAIRLYRRAVQELQHQRPKAAENDASHAARLDPQFADAEALAATAALAQRQFSQAKVLAQSAVQQDAGNEKAWVALATADNYTAQYADAVQALRHVPNPETAGWQVAYQWARAEAGLGNGEEVLLWVNRAALTAPQSFAPLHLLRASALLAAGQPAAGADELEAYLSVAGRAALDRAALTAELQRLREMSKATIAADVPGDAGSESNALAN